MTRHIRFSFQKNVPPTTPDASPFVRYGILDGDTVYETDSLQATTRGAAHAFSDVRLLPPCWPSKIVCVGRNYAEHAKELGNAVPAEPLIFMKPPSSLLADGEAIVYPPISSLLSYEGELGVVIGKRTRNVAAKDALAAVFGYTALNDVTARDLQKKDGQWTRGKGFDTFCPVGPWIVPAAEVQFDQIRVRTTVDGVVKQDAPVSDMIFSVSDIIAFVSQFMTLEPGDLIATGTPPGVGPLEPEARVEVDVLGVGILRNWVTGG